MSDQETTSIAAGVGGATVAEPLVLQPLFRSEVLDERRAQWLGTVVLTPTRLHRWFAISAAVIALALLALVFFASFTRTARVTGWLVPTAGLTRVFTPQAGVVTALYVHEGDIVHKGDRLMALSGEVTSRAVGSTEAEIARQLAERKRSLLKQRAEHEQLTLRQQQSLRQRIDALSQEYEQLGLAIQLQEKRVKLSVQNVRRNRKLLKRHFVAPAAVEQAEAAQLEQSGQLAGLERDRAAKLGERLTLESELQQLPLKAQAERAELDREVAALEQEVAMTEARRELIIPAPESGLVTAVLAEVGGEAAPNSPLLSIVPAGSRLEAHLYSPSRAIGFVRPGERVLLRYQAYPYQKFGHYEGRVVSVSRSPLSPAELPPKLTGLVQSTGSADPVYRVTVKLQKQTVRAYGKEIQLEPGAQLEADIALERRRLYEWVLDPLYTLTGRWSG